MSKYENLLSASIGKKLIMALTGLFLCLFLIVHLSGNLQLLKHDNGQAFNVYAHFMTHFTPIKVTSFLLYATILIHALYALFLTLDNKKARPVAYAVTAASPDVKWSSRNMGILGSFLFLFIVIHMGNFWYKTHRDDYFGGSQMPFKEYKTDVETGRQLSAQELPAGDYEYAVFTEKNAEGKTVEVVRAKDLQKEVEVTFGNPVYVAFYVLAMVALAFHLYHGFASSFQTVGMDHKRYKPIIKFWGIWVFAVIIPLGFASMPIILYLFN